ncbi:hypothetical protein [Bradyrhizobium sp. SSUT77]|uniref:hypothetical protein n=1 Tax=Bradyrhizobium sp. SSUT77 TaxID=3040603 RepID=UPI0024487385|nr:hypothetical protein [Bradyrhizobium sp. SSUT77]MDH2344406.1 hypothetical protein [Bradyrhizobium sp. SSUT77]
MDNLSGHRSKLVRQRIRSAGAKYKILARSESDRFAKLKHLLRKAAARTVDTVGCRS